MGSAATLRGRLTRRLAWAALYSALAAGATMAARRVASGVWRRTTGEEPPAKK